MSDLLPATDGLFLGETTTPRRWDGSRLINLTLPKWLATPLYSFDGIYPTGEYNLDHKDFTLTKKSMITPTYGFVFAAANIPSELVAEFYIYCDLNVIGYGLILKSVTVYDFASATLMAITPTPIDVGAHTLDLWLINSGADVSLNFTVGSICINPQEE